MLFRVLVPVTGAVLVAGFLVRFFFGGAAFTLAGAAFRAVTVALAGVARVDGRAPWGAFLAVDFLLAPDGAVRTGLDAALLRVVELVFARLLAVTWVPARELRAVALPRSFRDGAALFVRVFLVCVWVLPLAGPDGVFDGVPDFFADDFFGDLIAFFATVVAFCAPLSGRCPARR